MNNIHSGTIYINPAQYDVHKMEAPARLMSIMQMLQINDQGRLSSGKNSIQIAEEFGTAIKSLSEQERIEFKEILPKLPIVSATRIHIETLLGQ